MFNTADMIDTGVGIPNPNQTWLGDDALIRWYCICLSFDELFSLKIARSNAKIEQTMANTT